MQSGTNLIFKVEILLLFSWGNFELTKMLIMLIIINFDLRYFSDMIFGILAWSSVGLPVVMDEKTLKSKIVSVMPLCHFLLQMKAFIFPGLLSHWYNILLKGLWLWDRAGLISLPIWYGAIWDFLCAVFRPGSLNKKAHSLQK